MSNNDQDFEAAVVQLRRDHVKAWIKFGAGLILGFVFLFTMFAFGLTIGDAVKEALGVHEGNVGALPEADVP